MPADTVSPLLWLLWTEQEFYRSASSRTSQRTVPKETLSVFLMWSTRRPGVETRMLMPLRSLRTRCQRNDITQVMWGWGGAGEDEEQKVKVDEEVKVRIKRWRWGGWGENEEQTVKVGKEVKMRSRSWRWTRRWGWGIPGLLCLPLLSSHQDSRDDPSKRLQEDKHDLLFHNKSF